MGKLHHVHQLVAGEELEVYQHLVVARAARVYLLAHVAELAGEHQLHLRVYVFHAVFDDKPALVGHVVDVLEFGGKRHELVVGEQTYRLQHGDVGHRAQHVVLGEIEVELAVAAHGEALYLLVYFKILFPEFVHCGHLFISDCLQRVGYLLDAFL